VADKFVMSKKIGRVGDDRRSRRWGKLDDSGRNAYGGTVALPICPYGCGEEGQLLEVVMGEDGGGIGIFTDSDGCRFTADVEVGEPPTKKKLVIGPDGEYHEVP
jgi:hypothetical protein